MYQINDETTIFVISDPEHIKQIKKIIEKDLIMEKYKKFLLDHDYNNEIFKKYNEIHDVYELNPYYVKYYISLAEKEKIFYKSLGYYYYTLSDSSKALQYFFLSEEGVQTLEYKYWYCIIYAKYQRSYNVTEYFGHILEFDKHYENKYYYLFYQELKTILRHDDIKLKKILLHLEKQQFLLFEVYCGLINYYSSKNMLEYDKENILILIKYYNIILDKFPEKFNYTFKECLADIYHRNEEYDKALKLYIEIYNTYKKDLELQKNIFKCYAKTNKISEALEWLEKNS